jgi:hypothetical protein
MLGGGGDYIRRFPCLKMEVASETPCFVKSDGGLGAINEDGVCELHSIARAL